MVVDKFLRPISATLRFDLLVRFLLHRVRELLFINFLFLLLKSKVNVKYYCLMKFLKLLNRMNISSPLKLITFT